MISKLLEFEIDRWSRGEQYVAGVDEAGRGPLAGPIVAAAVILNKNHLTNNDVASPGNNDVFLVKGEGAEKYYQKINDSKKLSQKKREVLFDFIKKYSISYSIIKVSNEKIDKNGIGNANKLALSYAIKGLKIKPHHVLSDYYEIADWSRKKQTNITRGDSKSISIAAASILAKVYRDRLMIKYHEKYPEYGFDKHKGYGTKYHREQILKIGPCEIHRKSFEPIKSYLPNR